MFGIGNILMALLMASPFVVYGVQNLKFKLYDQPIIEANVRASERIKWEGKLNELASKTNKASEDTSNAFRVGSTQPADIPSDKKALAAKYKNSKACRDCKDKAK